MTHLSENEEKSKPRVRVRKTEKPKLSEADVQKIARRDARRILEPHDRKVMASSGVRNPARERLIDFARAHLRAVRAHPAYLPTYEKEREAAEIELDRRRKQRGDRTAKWVRRMKEAHFTPEQSKKSKAGRKSAATKARRSEAWWNKRVMSPEYNFFYRNFLSRCIRAYLSPTEWAVLSFIFDRTLGWDKEWERISVRQFLYGSKPNEQGFKAFCGIGIQSETTLREALKTLVRYKLIQVKEHEGGSRSFSLTRLSYLAGEIAKMNQPEGTEVRYRAKWPKQEEYIEICSNVACNQ